MNLMAHPIGQRVQGTQGRTVRRGGAVNPTGAVSKSSRIAGQRGLHTIRNKSRGSPTAFLFCSHSDQGVKASRNFVLCLRVQNDGDPDEGSIWR